MNRSILLSRLLPGICLLAFFSQTALGQGENPLHIFGYYQNAFEKYTRSEITPGNTTFLTQQLNLIVQKDLSSKLRSFVNFEFLNTFEGSLGWGAASLKEAWVRYDADPRLKLKIGLHIPTFNHLNDIKISTPLLPYIVRPIVYETSLQDAMDIEAFVPERAFFQVYGVLSRQALSYHYAFYMGNSPNINNDRFYGQTGVDTTRFMLVGGRLGIQWDNTDSRFSEFRLGISSTFDKINEFEGVAELVGPYVDDSRPAESFTELARWRVGGDLGLYWNNWYLLSEFITVFHGEIRDMLEINRTFAYATLGMLISDRWDVYLSTWHGLEYGRVRDRVLNPQYDLREMAILNVYTGGAKYAFSPRLVLKAQVALVDRDYERDVLEPFGTAFLDANVEERTMFAIYGLALSVFF